MKYRKKPVEINAIKWDGSNLEECVKFLGADYIGSCLDRCINGRAEIKIKTLEGMHIASKGDYLICGVKGEHYPCKPDIFDLTYEAADE